MVGRDGSKGWREIGPGESRRLLGDRFDRFLEPCAGSAGRAVVVEVGCGDGRGTAVLCERLEHRPEGGRPLLVALDVDLGKVIDARRRLRTKGLTGVRLVAADLYDLPFAAASSHYVVGLNVSYLIDRSPFFREVATILIPDGKVLLYDLIPKDGERRWFPFSICLSRRQLDRSGSPAEDPVDRYPESI